MTKYNWRHDVSDDNKNGWLKIMVTKDTGCQQIIEDTI